MPKIGGRRLPAQLVAVAAAAVDEPPAAVDVPAEIESGRRGRRRVATKRAAKYVEDNDVDDEEEEEEEYMARPAKRARKSKKDAPEPKAKKAKKPTKAELREAARIAALETLNASGAAFIEDAPEDNHLRSIPYVPKADKPIRDRIERALGVGAGHNHRLYLIDTQRLSPTTAPDGGSQGFTVQGTSGNAYTVKICSKPTCTCPDFHIRKHICKHIVFCFIRVLRRSPNDPVIWQKELVPSELRDVLGVFDGGVDQSALAHGRVRAAYAQATGAKLNIAVPEDPEMAAAVAVAQAEEQKEAVKDGRPVEGDCPICYEEMEAGAEPVCTCKTCGNHCHKTCFQRWTDSKKSSHQPLTCVWCRSPWQDKNERGGGGPSPAKLNVSGVRGAAVVTAGFGRQYVNLSQLAGNEQPSLEDLYGQNARWMVR